MKRKTRRRLILAILPLVLIWMFIAQLFASVGILLYAMGLLMLGDKNTARNELSDLVKMWRFK